MSDWQQSLINHFPNLNFHKDYPLSRLSYFRVGGQAELLVEVASRQRLIKLIRYLADKQLKLTILGAASNVVISDHGVTGLVVIPKFDKFRVVNRSDQQVVVRVGSGLKTSKLVRQAIKVGAGGLEELIGVPGTVGGAVYNNAHFQQILFGDLVKRVEVINPDGKVYWLMQKECRFDYEQSRFQQTREIILQVELQLIPTSPEQSRTKIKQALKYRQKTQPVNQASSGCIFKNPKNTPQLRKLFPQFADLDLIPASFLIDQAGLKGVSRGGIEVSQKHAGFLVNTGQGTASQIKDLINHIKQEVKKQFSVELEEEIFFID